MAFPVVVGNWGCFCRLQIKKSDNLFERIEVWLLSIRWLHSNDPMTINDRPFQDHLTDHLKAENKIPF
jgi:hypothetical protein